jgi:hypothetical protein
MEPEKDIFETWRDKKTPLLRRIKWKIEEIGALPRTIKHGFKNLWYWLPVIWSDRNWDSHYTLEILKHKLTAQSNYISERDIHTRAQYDARNMRICISLIDKVNDETYSSAYSDYANTKHWFEPCDDDSGNSLWKTRELSETYDEYFAKYPLIHKRVLAGEGVFGREGREEDKQIIAMNIGQINQDRAHRLLFNILHDHMLAWWD